MPDRYLTSLLCPLPEDIAHLKGAGEYELVLALIDRRLAGPLPRMLRMRLETEKRMLAGLPHAYTLTHEQLLLALRQRIPSFQDKELQALLLDGKLDFIYLNGTRYYHEDTVGSLLKTQSALNARAQTGAYNADRSALDAVIARMMQHDIVFRYRLRATTQVRTFEPGTIYRIHMPLAARSMQQSAAEDVQSSLLIVSQDDENAPQRTAYLESSLRDTPAFTFEYTCTQRPRYVNAVGDSAHVVYPQARPVCKEDLAELPPHLAFTPYLRALAQELRGDEGDPVLAARRFYDFITTRVMYAYQRPYRLIENGAEYAAVNLRGDCGLQALLFIALCRISGIPARWQSGLYAAPGDVGSHDWAEFYSPRFGWLPVDCSFGGAAKRMGSELRWNFYFGNLDPWRMVANRAYYAPFAPAKNFARADPYDNQRGEIETDARGLTGGEFSTRYEMLWHEESEAES